MLRFSLVWRLAKTLFYLLRITLSVMTMKAATSPWLLVRLTFTIAMLLAISGYTRDRLGYGPVIEKGRFLFRATLEEGLRHVFRLPRWAETLTAASDLILVYGMAWFVVAFVKRQPSYLYLICVIFVSIKQGLKATGNAQLTVVLSLPVTIAFGIAWTGAESLAALALSVLVILFLSFAVHHDDLERTVEQYTKTQTTIGTINEINDQA